MSDIAIQVDGISKLYHIGHLRTQRRPMMQAITDTFAAPFRRTWGLLTGNAYSAAELDEPLWALKDVSFEVKRGEVLGLLGRNGAGKSTLLKILSRITQPTEGSATIHGRTGSLLEVGTGFHPELTGRENVFLNGTMLGMRRTEIKKKFDEIVDFAEIEKFIDTPVKHYSSGMYTRLAFAVAAHLEPEIMIVDEVLAVGDASFQKKCLGKITEIAGQGRTVLFVSHNMSSVESLTSQCVLLENGMVTDMGPSRKVIEHYLAYMKSNGDADLTNAPRISPSHGTKIRICRITVPEDHQVGFRLGESLVFDIDLKSELALKGLCFGATILDATGTPILSTFSPDTVETPHKGHVVYRLTINDSRLAPGSYFLALAISDGGRGQARLSYDLIKPGPAFSIASISINGNSAYQWSSGSFGPIMHTNAEVMLCPE